ncbi:uncharacterized protein NECHADRAFT_82690 [Fusarium vanettenii 77-13-4]|uniref:C3H1-type domain-containing protein n=1 Tax=Fusarium vanettenii (strain ATCC MYA-4622 / CBS 123669 / FGSC 9596 / NRRL 45880 / 77-13-4) TaxID=660122 RepID=C7YXY3_FUSV7|nr:uncharacterized protein NECHADRAFT_82690 [Fusarium vanettenii 77-13-4]EEU43415.1 hypothetical protein NECHADRAFT_82690 [Fusarium vanettenii 77-13-4]
MPSAQDSSNSKDELAAQIQKWNEQDNERHSWLRVGYPISDDLYAPTPLTALFSQTLQQTLEAFEKEKFHLKKENDQLTAQNKDLKNHLKTQQKEKDPYVAVLVDGDGAKFQDSFLQDPEEGATNAALAIRQHVAEYVKDTDLSSDITIFARVFANVKDLAHSLRLSGIVSYEDKFLKFVTNFTNARAEFDFVDVGSGKENADSKMRRMLKYYHDDVRCKKIFFVACHDAGYAHDLRPYIDDQGSRLVLVETTPAAARIKKLGLPIISFDNVFHSGLLQNETRVIPQSPPKQISSPSPPPPRAQPPVATTTVTATTTTIRSGNGGISTKYKGSYAAAGGTGSHQNIDVGPTKSRAPKIMEFNQDNVRLDPPAKMPGNTPAQDSYKRKLLEARNQAFCNGHYLSGTCSWGPQCTREHDTKLTPDEMVIHRYKARSCPCFVGPGCPDFACPMSHHCPQDPFCTRGNECKFKNTVKFGDMHLTKAGMRPVKRWTEGCEFPEPIVI